MIIADTHSHTAFSSDSESSIKSMIEAAINCGLKIYTITDHMDYDNHYYLVPSAAAEGFVEGDFILNTPDYYKTLCEFKDAYKDRIDIRIGVEYGLQRHLGTHLNDYSKAYDFDCIIGSVHEVDGVDPYYREFIESKSIIDAYRNYFLTECTLAKELNGFDIFAHIDYGMRYHHELIPDFEFKYSVFYDELDGLLKTIIEKGVSAELNTNTFKYFGNNTPMHDILMRYKELGGEMISIGSDAHTPDRVAKEFRAAEEMLQSLGFEYYTVYKNRKPVFYKF